MSQIQRRSADFSQSKFTNEPEIIQRIFLGRGITGPEEIKRSANALLPVSTMKGITEACQLLHDGLISQKRITIVGDFDADGATSTALMMIGLRQFGFQQVNYKVPNRFDYGYGLSPQLAQEIIQQGTDIIITVDNGISCIDGIALCKKAGIQVIVTDHHLPGKSLPNADAIVNPNQVGCQFDSKNLAGVGVAFYLLLGFRAKLRELNWFEQQQLTPPNLANLLDIVALGTVADVVKLDHNNRILVYQGLARIKQGVCREGIKALLAISNKNLRTVKASDFGFSIGPKLNAAGRLDDMSYGIRCLLTEDRGQALKMAEDLNGLNNERKEIEQGMRMEAEAAVNTINITSGHLPNSIVVYQENWHQGVIGIVAGRVKDKYYRPTIAFAQGDVHGSDIEIKGSARSIQGVHIRDVLDAVNTRYPGLINKFGGHAMAAGLSIYQSKLPQFKAAFDEVVLESLNEEILTQVIYTDGELSSNELTIEFCQLLDSYGPWGQGFAEPAFDGTFTLVNQRLVGSKHLKMVLANDDGLVLDAIHFNADLTQWPNNKANKVHLVYQLDINEFRGKSTVQLLVREIRLAD